jgi:tetratricopeptide (TPR) repeat protein
MTALVNLADLARMEGAYPAARQEYEAALRLSREVSYRRGEGVSQYELGHVLRVQGEYSRAVTLIENAVTIFEEIGEHHRKASALITLGQIYAFLGDAMTAERWLTRYQQFSDQAKNCEETIHFLEVRTVLAFNLGEPAQALAYATEGWQRGQTGRPPEVQAYALIGIGHAQRQLGELAAATTAYQQAFDLYTTIQRPDLAAEAQAGLAALAQQQGDRQRAVGLVEAVLAQLAAQPISGQDEPFFLYLTCYQVLAAAQDPRAPMILQQGYTLLQRYAEQITDERLRQSFLENVPVHRALRQVTGWGFDKLSPR